MGSGGATSLKRLEDSRAVCEPVTFSQRKCTDHDPATLDTSRILHYLFVNDLTYAQSSYYVRDNRFRIFLQLNFIGRTKFSFVLHNIDQLVRVS